MEVEALSSGIRRLVAPNPSPMTGGGTNTYVIGCGSVAVIDPGPNLNQHLDALLAATHGEEIEAILITHGHRDHTEAAPALAAATGAQTYGFGDSDAGRSAIMERLAQGGQIAGGEGVDAFFAPDIRLTDGAELCGTRWRVRALWTPGHIGNHLSFVYEGHVFCGDHIFLERTTLISPPDGDLTAYRASCEKLMQYSDHVFLPGHGVPISAPGERLSQVLAHRDMREAQVLAALRTGPQTAASIVPMLYQETPMALWPAAERNVLAHLIDLLQRGGVECLGALSSDTPFALVGMP